MPQKRDAYEEELDIDQDSKFSFDKMTWFIGLLFIILAELFFYFLSLKTEASFGLKEIIFAFMIGAVTTLFLIWARFIIFINKYLGAFIGFTGIIAITYSLSRKYQGTYTTIFMSIGIILALFYLIFYFIKAGKK